MANQNFSGSLNLNMITEFQIQNAASNMMDQKLKIS